MYGRGAGWAWPIPARYSRGDPALHSRPVLYDVTTALAPTIEGVDLQLDGRATAGSTV